MPKASAGKESAPQKQVQPHTLPMKAQAARLGRREIIREALHAKAAFLFLYMQFCSVSMVVRVAQSVLACALSIYLLPFFVSKRAFSHCFGLPVVLGLGEDVAQGRNHGIKHSIVSGRSQWQLLGCLFSLIVQKTTLRIDGRRRSWPSRTFTTLSSNCKGAILAARVLKLQVVKAFKIMIEASSSLSSI